MSAYDLAYIIESLQSYGVTDVLLPFLLIFTIIYAVLEKSKILGDTKKNYNVVVALVISLLVVFPHVTGDYPGNFDVVDVINKSLPMIALLVVAIVMFMILVGMFGASPTWTGPVTGWVVIVAFIAVVWVFSGAAWGSAAWDSFVDFLGEDIVALIIIILVFGIIVALITGEGRDSKSSLFYNIGDSLGEFFKR